MTKQLATSSQPLLILLGWLLCQGCLDWSPDCTNQLCPTTAPLDPAHDAATGEEVGNSADGGVKHDGGSVTDAEAADGGGPHAACRYGDWGPWSECDNTCVAGAQRRTRERLAGCASCDFLEETEVCYVECTVCDGDQVVTTRDQLSQLRSCDVVAGNLDISLSPGVTSLEELGALLRVEGDLIIRSNPDLESLQGLERLESCEGQLAIIGNPKLSDLSSLGHLFTVWIGIVVADNAKLLSLNGFESLDSLNAVRIDSNPELRSLNGLGNLEQVHGPAEVVSNASLASLAGLGRLRKASSLEISGNDTLTSLAGLEALEEVDGDLIIERNPELESLDGLSRLRAVNGTLGIDDNPALMRIHLGELAELNSLYVIGTRFVSETGFPRLVRLEWLTLRGNTALTALNGFSSLELVEDSIWIDRNPKLTSLEGLSALTTAGLTADHAGIDIEGNKSLVSLEGAENLESVSVLAIEANQKLVDCSGLTGLKNSLGDVSIVGNDSLGSLNGLEGLQQVGGDLLIEENPELKTLDGLQNLQTIEGNLGVENSSSLERIRLEKLSKVNGLYVVGAGALSETSFPRLVRLTWLSVRRTALTTLSGFSGLQVAEESLWLESNPKLTSLEGLSALTTAGLTIDDAGLAVESNETLTSLAGAETLKRVGDLTIGGNPQLRNLVGLSGLAHAVGDVNIRDNRSLESLSGLEGLTKVDGDVRVEDSPGIESLAGLSALSEIAGSFFLKRIAGLRSLLGLESLTGVGGDLSISENQQLVNLQGLPALTQVVGELKLTSNENLRSLSGLPPLTRLGGFYAEENGSLATLAPMDSWLDGVLIGPITAFDNGSLPECEVEAFDRQQSHPDAVCESKCAPNDPDAVCTAARGPGRD